MCSSSSSSMHCSYTEFVAKLSFKCKTHRDFCRLKHSDISLFTGHTVYIARAGMKQKKHTLVCVLACRSNQNVKIEVVLSKRIIKCCTLSGILTIDVFTPLILTNCTLYHLCYVKCFWKLCCLDLLHWTYLWHLH